MGSHHRTRFPAIVSVLFIALLVSLVALPPGARTAQAASGWETQTTGVSTYLTDASAASASTAWAVGYADILKTTNGGSSWVQQSVSDPLAFIYGVYAVDANTVWAVGAEMLSGTPLPAGALVLRTTNGGSTWEKIPAPTLNLSTPNHGLTLADVKALDANNALVCGMGVDLDSNGNPIYHSVIAKTTNGGTNWTYPYLSTGKLDPNALWDLRSYNITSASPGVFYATGQNNVLKSTDTGDHWTVIRTETTGSMDIDVEAVDANNAWLTVQSPLLGQSVYGPYDITTVLKTTDGGKTWAPKLETGDNVMDKPSIGSAGPKIAWTGSNGCIFKTGDGGATWALQYR